MEWRKNKSWVSLWLSGANQGDQVKLMALTEASTQTDSRLPACRRAVLSKCDADTEKYIPGLRYWHFLFQLQKLTDWIQTLKPPPPHQSQPDFLCRRGDRDDHRTCTLLTRRYIILDAAVHIFQRSYSAVSFDFSPNILNPVTIDSIKMDESSIQVLNELTLSHMPLTDFES